MPGHHAVTLHSLALTIALEPGIVDRLDAFRRKRNRTSYEATGAVSEQEVSELLSLAERLRINIDDWLQKRYPALAGLQKPA